MIFSTLHASLWYQFSGSFLVLVFGADFWYECHAHNNVWQRKLQK